MSKGSRSDKPDPPARLVVLRDNEATLRRLLVDAEPQHAPALARELRATVREIAEILAEAPAEVSLSDELAEKRRRRVGAAVDPAPPTRGANRRRNGRVSAG